VGKKKKGGGGGGKGKKAKEKRTLGMEEGKKIEKNEKEPQYVLCCH
jgi:hypothetical protein